MRGQFERFSSGICEAKWTSEAWSEEEKKKKKIVKEKNKKWAPGCIRESEGKKEKINKSKFRGIRDLQGLKVLIWWAIH